MYPLEEENVTKCLIALMTDGSFIIEEHQSPYADYRAWWADLGLDGPSQVYKIFTIDSGSLSLSDRCITVSFQRVGSDQTLEQACFQISNSIVQDFMDIVKMLRLTYDLNFASLLIEPIKAVEPISVMHYEIGEFSDESMAASSNGVVVSIVDPESDVDAHISAHLSKEIEDLIWS